MFTALWKLLTNEHSWADFTAKHGTVVLRVLMFGAGKATTLFAPNSSLYWIGTTLEIIAMGYQGGEKNTNIVTTKVNPNA